MDFLGGGEMDLVRLQAAGEPNIWVLSNIEKKKKELNQSVEIKRREMVVMDSLMSRKMELEPPIAPSVYVEARIQTQNGRCRQI